MFYVFALYVCSYIQCVFAVCVITCRAVMCSHTHAAVVCGLLCVPCVCWVWLLFVCVVETVCSRAQTRCADTYARMCAHIHGHTQMQQSLLLLPEELFCFWHLILSDVLLIRKENSWNHVRNPNSPFKTLTSLIDRAKAPLTFQDFLSLSLSSVSWTHRVPRKPIKVLSKSVVEAEQSTWGDVQVFATWCRCLERRKNWQVFAGMRWMNECVLLSSLCQSLAWVQRVQGAMRRFHGWNIFINIHSKSKDFNISQPASILIPTQHQSTVSVFCSLKGLVQMVAMVTVVQPLHLDMKVWSLGVELGSILSWLRAQCCGLDVPCRRNVDCSRSGQTSRMKPCCCKAAACGSASSSKNCKAFFWNREDTLMFSGEFQCVTLL